MRIRARVGAAAALAGLAYLGAIAWAGLAARPSPGDLIVVLGNAVTPAGAPGARLAARLDAALAVYRAGLAPRMLVSGGIEPGGQDEAAGMAAYLVARGVPATAVLQDPNGDDTFKTARNTAALLHGAGRVIVVTQWFHIARTELALRRFGITEISAAWPRFVEWRDAFSFLREAVGLAWYAMRPATPAAAS